MLSGQWHNRDLLLMPLASASALVAQGVELAQGTGVNVRTTPQVARPADAWGYINATWSRMREMAPAVPRPTRPLPPPARDASSATPPSARPRPLADTQPMPMRPMPSVASQARVDAQTESLLERYTRQLTELTGMVGCCIFDVAWPRPEDLASHGADLMAATIDASRGLGLGLAMPETAITLGAHHLLLRPVPRHPGLALHAVLDKTQANLTLARLQIQRMDTLFDDGAPTTR
jgi:hypothetical protein